MRVSRLDSEHVLSSRQVFKWLQNTEPQTLTDIERAARFYYLQQQAFGGKVAGQTWGTATTVPAPTASLRRLKESLSAVQQRLHGAYIEHLDWQECIKRYDRPHTLFYLDPPYWQTEGYGMPFDWSQYETMSRILRGIKGKAVLSINDHPDIRACFKGLQFEAVPITYIVCGGDKEVSRTELVIYSWDQKSEPAGLF